jgi:hypothetical protein
MWVLREARHHVPVIHAPAVAVREIGPDLTAAERHGGALEVVAFRVGVDVVHREDERIDAGPREAEFHEFDDGIGHEDSLR